jgi:hypothetical protein
VINPDVIFHDDSLGGDTLLDHRPTWVDVNVVHRQNLNQRRSVYAIANSNTALAAQHV